MDPILVVQNLTKRFDAAPTRSGIEGISFEVKKGEVVCLVGPSGAGKTTLLRCLAGLQAADSGSITHADNKAVTMVFQDYNLWPHLTVLQNILLAPVHVQGMTQNDAEQRAEDLLKKFDLHEKRHAFPESLSGGQRQRVALIRALITRPTLLLLDEITSALDPELVSSVLTAIKILAKEGQAMVIATHQLKFATEVADTILFLENGKLVQQNNPRDFIYAQKNPRIQEFIQSLSFYKPEISVYEGVDEFQAFQLGTLKRFKPGSPKCVMGSSGNRWFEAMGNYYDVYEKERLARGIKWKMLMYDESPLDRDLRLRHPEMNEYRLLPRHLENPANYYVFDDVVVIQIFGEAGSRPTIIEIRNPHVAKSYQNYFNLLWEQSAPIG